MSAEVSDVPLYNTAAVVQRTGVPAVTFRAWERRYGFPKPRRDPAGQRLYSERDIQHIRWLADQTGRGVAISRAIAMLRGGYAGPPPAEPIPSQAARSFETLQSEMREALLAFNAGRAEAVLAEAFALFSVEDVCLRLLEPLLVDVGDRWHAGQISVAEEHYASSFVRTRLFALLHAYESADGRGRLIFTACAPGEWHELGILLVSVFLVRRGYSVRYLGPNLPVEGLAGVVQRHRPDLVVLSAQSAETARELGGAAAALRAGPPPHPRLAFGGQAFNLDPSLRETIEGTYVGPDAAAAVEAVTRLLESTARRPRTGQAAGSSAETGRGGG